MGSVTRISRHPRYRWHPTRGDRARLREALTALHDEMRQQAADDPLPASWGGPVVKTGDGEELTEERARELLALAEAEDQADVLRGA